MTIGGAAAGGDRAGSSSGGRGGSKVIMHSDGSFYFEVDSTPGETTVVSWKKLLRDHAGEIAAGASSTSRPNAMAGGQFPDINAPPATPNPSPDMSIVPALGPAVQPPSSSFNSVFEKIERLYVKASSDEEDLNDVVMGDDNYDTQDSFIDDSDLNEYFLVDSSGTEYDGYFVHRGKLEGVEPSMVQNEQSKKRRGEDVAEGSDGNPSKKPRKPQQLEIKSPQAAGVAHTFSNLDEQEMKRQKRKQSNRESARRSRMRKQQAAEKMKRTNSEVQPVCQQQLKLVSDPSDRRIILRIPVIPKKECAGLENAIKELEKLVTETRPPSVAGQAGSSSQAIRRRLPQEIRKELAKVAGHAQASDGKITKELVDRLMSILGHLVQRNTLKRNLKTIVDAELAKHGKDNMVQLVKSKAPEEQAGASFPPRA